MPEPIKDSPIDFATVVYRPEVLLLKLQARSFRLLMREQAVNDIFILVNEDDPRSTLSAIEQEVLPEYGHFLPKVKIVEGNSLQRLPPSVNGWRRQQTLKLLAAKLVQSDVYVTLEAKNHFIRPAGSDAFLTRDGKMKSFRARQRGSLMPFFINALTYFGLDAEAHLDAAMPATTPFPLSAPLVREMMEGIEAREGVSFEQFFHSPNRNVTEFFLYFAHLVRVHSPVESVYSFGRRNTVTLFTRWPETDEQVRDALKKLSHASIVMFGLHKNRILKADDNTKREVCECWAAAGLFADVEEASRYLEVLKKSIQDGGTSEN